MTRTQRPRSAADVFAGVVFIGFGMAFGIGATAYDLGTLLRMGPGYFPLVCAVALTGLGVLVVVKAFIAPDPNVEASGPIQIRPLLLLSGALAFFTVTIDGLGFVIATFGTALLAAFARRGTSLGKALMIAGVLSATCYLIFVVALGQRLDVVGEWISG
jgi:hypothetical protein